MRRTLLSTLTSPAALLACGIGAVGYFALNPAREATAHERYLRDLVPEQSDAERRVRTRAHRLACPTCLEVHTLGVLRIHEFVERSRILDDLRARGEHPIDHFRGCPRCRDRPIL